jgi:TetR/AcrR family transcriptional regulator, transcriptional repressor for nem operon
MNPSSDTRARILQTARSLFYTHGFGATSLGDLARASGVPKGNFYYHFPTKDDVLLAVVRARQEDAARAFEAWQDALPGPRARIERFLQMVVSERDALVCYGCPVGSLATELRKRQDALGEAAAAGLALYERFLCGQLGELGCGEEEAGRLARRLLSRVQGAILLTHVSGDARVLDEELEEARGWLDGLCGSAVMGLA